MIIRLSLSIIGLSLSIIGLSLSIIGLSVSLELQQLHFEHQRSIGGHKLPSRRLLSVGVLWRAGYPGSLAQTHLRDA